MATPFSDLARGVFFLGYMLFQVPSNLLVQACGARRTISALMVVWGAFSITMMLVRTPQAFYIVRFCLGLAEAGFFPGVVLYLTYWYRPVTGPRPSRFLWPPPLSQEWSEARISGALLTMQGWNGLSGWQCLFLFEGDARAAAGLHHLLLSPRRPPPSLLAQRGREGLDPRLNWPTVRKERAILLQGLISPRVWYLSFVYMSLVCGMYSVTLWMPQILSGLTGMSDLAVGALSALPYLTAAIGMVIIGRHSDATGERRLARGCFRLVGRRRIVGCRSVPGQALLGLPSLCLAALGIWGTLGTFWAVPTAALRGTAAATGIAVINSVGNLGGFIGPYAVGLLKEAPHSFAAGLYALSALLAIGGFLVVIVAREERKP